MRSRRGHRPKARGFALFVVTVVVALVAVMAISLLDQVGLDLIIAGEHRKTRIARDDGVGAMTEVLSDDTLLSNLPNADAPNLRYRYIDRDGTSAYVRDPDGLSTPVSAGESAYFHDVGTSAERAYRSNVRLVRFARPPDTGLNKVGALVYEVWLEASVNQGEATSQVRTEIWRPIRLEEGREVQPAMAR